MIDTKAVSYGGTVRVDLMKTIIIFETLMLMVLILASLIGCSILAKSCQVYFQMFLFLCELRFSFVVNWHWHGVFKLHIFIAVQTVILTRSWLSSEHVWNLEILVMFTIMYFSTLSRKIVFGLSTTAICHHPQPVEWLVRSMCHLLFFSSSYYYLYCTSLSTRICGWVISHIYVLQWRVTRWHPLSTRICGWVISHLCYAVKSH